MTPVDNLWTTRRKPVQLIHILAMYLTQSVRFMLSRRARGRASSQRVVNLLLVLCLFIGSFAINAQTAQASNQRDHFILYAHSRIINFEQFKCFVKLIDKENRHWDPKARNGSHYGIGQMRNERYRDLDGYTQIDWTLRYIAKRYGNECKAWLFFKANRYH